MPAEAARGGGAIAPPAIDVAAVDAQLIAAIFEQDDPQAWLMDGDLSNKLRDAFVALCARSAMGEPPSLAR